MPVSWQFSAIFLKQTADFRPVFACLKKSLWTQNNKHNECCVK